MVVGGRYCVVVFGCGVGVDLVVGGDGVGGVVVVVVGGGVGLVIV